MIDLSALIDISSFSFLTTPFLFFGLFGIGDTGNYYITNSPGDASALGQMGQYYRDRIQYEKELQLATLAELALAALQLVYYWNEFEEAIDERDNTIDEMIEFMDWLRAQRDGVDKPRIMQKRDILGLEAPVADACAENVRYMGDVFNDGNAVDASAMRFVRESCCGIPYGWGLHDGDLAAALSVPIEGSFQGAAADRRRQEFLKNQAALVQAAQRSIKSVINAGSILAYYDRAISIYGGLADMFIQGFNSAGAALGVALGKLAHAQVSPSNSTASDPMVGHRQEVIMAP